MKLDAKAYPCRGVHLWRDMDGDGVIVRLKVGRDDGWFRTRLSRADAITLANAIHDALAEFPVWEPPIVNG